MVSNINTGLVKDRVSYALHNVKEIIIMQMRQKRESVNEAWRKAEMETLLNPETTEEWRHDIMQCIAPDNMNTRPSLLKIKNTARAWQQTNIIKPWHMAADPPDPNSHVHEASSRRLFLSDTVHYHAGWSHYKMRTLWPWRSAHSQQQY